MRKIESVADRLRYPSAGGRDVVRDGMRSLLVEAHDTFKQLVRGGLLPNFPGFIYKKEKVEELREKMKTGEWKLAAGPIEFVPDKSKPKIPLTREYIVELLITYAPRWDRSAYIEQVVRAMLEHDRCANMSAASPMGELLKQKLVL